MPKMYKCILVQNTRDVDDYHGDKEVDVFNKPI